MVRRDEAHDFIEVALVASREVVEADDPLIEFQQCLEHVGPDEAGYTGDEPGLRVLREVEAKFFVARHGCSMGRNGGEWGPGLQGGGVAAVFAPGGAPTRTLRSECQAGTPPGANGAAVKDAGRRRCGA